MNDNILSRLDAKEVLCYQLLGVNISILEIPLPDKVNFCCAIGDCLIGNGMVSIEDAKFCARELVVSVINSYINSIKETSEEIASMLSEMSKKKLIEKENRGEDFHD